MSKKSKTTSAPATASNAQTGTEAEYQAIVEEGKAITADMSGKQWTLGDLADKVEKAYGENRLEQFAEDIRFDGDFRSLGRYRNICRAFPKTRGRPRFFATAQALATHPERFEIVERNPDIGVREAQELMLKLSAEDEFKAEEGSAPKQKAAPSKVKGAKKTTGGEQPREWLKDSKRWVNNRLVLANNIANEVNEIVKDCTSEQHYGLALAAEQEGLVETLRKASDALAELADWLEDKPKEKEANKQKQKPARAATSVQPSA
jgi:hypothetical protein